MTSYFINFFLTQEIFLFLSICILLNLFFVFFNKKISILLDYKYYTTQKIHENVTLRIGGLLILSNLFIYNFFFTKYIFFEILLFSSIFFFIPSIIEDFFHNIKPVYRFFGLLVSSVIFLNFFNVDLPYLPFDFLNNIYIQYFFYIFTLVLVANGSNLIDGVNGLCCASFCSSLVSILFLSFFVNDILIINLCFILLLVFLVFLFFNYPFGKFFLGDSGAYFVGWSVGILAIYLFSRHSDLNVWNAVLIFFYPSFEVLFSIFRKVFFDKSSPFKPDAFHLHTKLYYNLKFSFINQPGSNSMVLPLLSFFWLSPLIAIPWIFQSSWKILLFLLLFMIIYCVIYIYLPRKNNDFI